MADLRFKIDVTHVLSNFTSLAEAFELATKEGLEEAADFTEKRIVEIYENETKHGEHPITIAKRNAGLDKVDIPSLIQAKHDEKGDLRVGFFGVDKEAMRIIYMQEFGGSIVVTEKMRNWYNAMAFVSKGWRPDHATISPEDFPYEFQPLRATTNRFIIPPKFFLRRTFHELGNTNILVNRLRFALESHYRSGNISAGTTIGGGAAEQTNLDDSPGVSRGS